MKYFIKRLIIFIIPFVFFLFGIALYNIWLDPFGVINANMAQQKTEPNQHYLKIKYCIDNPQKFNSFLFGSSRVGKIDVTKIPDSNKWYNFTYSEAIPAETLEDLKTLLNNKVKIKKILIGLDEISYLISPESHESESLRKSYKNRIDPYLYYLFLKPSYSMYLSIKNADSSKFYSEGTYKVIYNSGSFPPNKKDIYIEKNTKIHESDSIFNMPYWSPLYKERINKSIKEINEIDMLCKTNKIEVVYFINPIYEVTYTEAVSHNFLSFIKKLSSTITFYDFSGINAITSNRLNFYETSHYRPLVGDKIIQRIFNSEKNSEFVINKNNVDSVIKEKQVELNKARTHNSKIPASRVSVLR